MRINIKNSKLFYVVFFLVSLSIGSRAGAMEIHSLMPEDVSIALVQKKMRKIEGQRDIVNNSLTLLGCIYQMHQVKRCKIEDVFRSKERKLSHLRSGTLDGFPICIYSGKAIRKLEKDQAELNKVLKKCHIDMNNVQEQAQKFIESRFSFDKRCSLLQAEIEELRQQKKQREKDQACNEFANECIGKFAGIGISKLQESELNRFLDSTTFGWRNVDELHEDACNIYSDIAYKEFVPYIIKWSIFRCLGQVDRGMCKPISTADYDSLCASSFFKKNFSIKEKKQFTEFVLEKNSELQFRKEGLQELGLTVLCARAFLDSKKKEWGGRRGSSYFYLFLFNRIEKAIKEEKDNGWEGLSLFDIEDLIGEFAPSTSHRSSGLKPLLCLKEYSSTVQFFISYFIAQFGWSSALDIKILPIELSLQIIKEAQASPSEEHKFERSIKEYQCRGEMSCFDPYSNHVHKLLENRGMSELRKVAFACQSSNSKTNVNHFIADSSYRIIKDLSRCDSHIYETYFSSEQKRFLTSLLFFHKLKDYEHPGTGQKFLKYNIKDFTEKVMYKEHMKDPFVRDYVYSVIPELREEIEYEPSGPAFSWFEFIKQRVRRLFSSLLGRKQSDVNSVYLMNGSLHKDLSILHGHYLRQVVKKAKVS